MPEKPNNVGIGVEITFGKPKKDCAGRGFCKVKFTVDVSLGVPTSTGEGAGTLDVVDGQTFIRVWKKTMDPTTTEMHFSNNTFLVEESASFETKEFGTINIVQGEYPIVDKGEYYEVVFK